MITAFLPCRKGSQRIPDKNVKPFAGVQGGLLEIKLTQLLACDAIDQIFVSSNDDRVLSFTQKIQDSRIIIDERPDHLGSSSTTTDALINYVAELISNSVITKGDLLWTHVTSPFVTELHYQALLNKYKEKVTVGYDSLITAKKIQGFLWDDKKPINYDREVEKWPRTQTIPPIYEIDSAAFIASSDIYLNFHDRMGKFPFIEIQEGICSLDIDWPDDFFIAEKIYEHYSAKNRNGKE
ncbi:cytidylyltransferase domain-containing protein [Pectobacterium versatile]|uniref:acylneuraminate cytidylyltransferase family protein n=1 Tax=Pectobacterium versatile TaxID=2488639 RepID=UPI00102E335C|nr:acylneuraminate cytidylyltransferase family protein [Pectobacterium versatile]TAI84932.1 acylneuraminate cytidylyltransferase family protein [Pectobacterium versatile]